MGRASWKGGMVGSTMLPFPHPLDPGEHCVVGVGLGAEDGEVNEVLVVDVLEQAHW